MVTEKQHWIGAKCMAPIFSFILPNKKDVNLD